MSLIIKNCLGFLNYQDATMLIHTKSIITWAGQYLISINDSPSLHSQDMCMVHLQILNTIKIEPKAL
jgi:hypothetical protein